MRLAVIADIHGNLPALETVLSDIDRRGVDAIVNLGDLVTAPLWPAETLDLLDTRPMPTVRGNHDRWLVERSTDSMTPSMRLTHQALLPARCTALAALPPLLRLDGDILAVHVTPASDTEYLLELRNQCKP